MLENVCVFWIVEFECYGVFVFVGCLELILIDLMD